MLGKRSTFYCFYLHVVAMRNVKNDRNISEQTQFSVWKAVFFLTISLAPNSETIGYYQSKQVFPDVLEAPALCGDAAAEGDAETARKTLLEWSPLAVDCNFVKANLLDNFSKYFNLSSKECTQTCSNWTGEMCLYKLRTCTTRYVPRIIHHVSHAKYCAPCTTYL